MKNRQWVLLAIGLFAFAGLASAATLNVPSSYSTVAAALAAANPGDTIRVAATYDSAQEKFPITVTKDNITISCDEGAVFRVPHSRAGIVFLEVEGGALNGAGITSTSGANPEQLAALGDVGVVVKDSTGVLIQRNKVHNLLSGIRLLGSSNCQVTDNKVYDIGVDTKAGAGAVRTGIGIFLEASNSNTLRRNEVYNSGEGLFLFESHDNEVSDDTYRNNTYMGVDLNDSSRNSLRGLKVLSNGTWGVYFMHSAENVLADSEIAGNKLGGIELAGSSLNHIVGNYIHDNGTNPNGDNIQVVVTSGDKVLFTAPLIFGVGPATPFGEMRAEKEFVERKVGWLGGFILDFDYELKEIFQKLASARGLISEAKFCVTGEVIDKGDGTKKTFTGALNKVVVPGSLTITGTTETDTETFTDNGNGTLTRAPNSGGTNTINYSTGAYSVEFEDPPLYNTPITADYCYYPNPVEDIERLVEKIKDAIAEKKCILNPDHILTRGELAGATPDSDLLDPEFNFTLPDSDHPLATMYGKALADLGLTPLDRDGADNFGGTPDDELSFDKITIIEIIKWLIRDEVLELKEKVRKAHDDGLINLCERDNLLQKLDAVLGYLIEINEIIDDAIVPELEKIDDKLQTASATIGWKTDTIGTGPGPHAGSLPNKPVIPGTVTVASKTATNVPLKGWDNGAGVFTGNATGTITYTTGAYSITVAGAGAGKAVTVSYLFADLAEADLWLEKAKLEIIEVFKMKLLIYVELALIWEKLGKINEEIPPDLTFNGTIIGKKEQAGVAITTDLPGNTGAGLTCPYHGTKDIERKICELVSRLNADVLAKKILKAVTGRDNFVPADIHFDHKGLTHSMGNLIASNVITTTVITNGLNIGIKLESPGNKVVNNLITNDDLEKGKACSFGKLDRGIIMLSSDNLVAYNAFECLDVAIERGGSEERPDVQQEYLFQKLAVVETWYYEKCKVTRDATVIAVLEKVDEPITVKVGPVTVRRNRIALNLFDHCGIGIDVILAESNVIDENVFFYCTDAGIMFRGTAGPHIVVKENDFVGGISVANAGATARDASQNYALNSPTSGPVTPPAATEPFCPGNFGTIVKFQELGIEQFYSAQFKTLPPMAQSSNLRRLVVAGITFNLPPEKPRVCADVFGAPPPPGLTRFYPRGWNMVSVPVRPVDPDPQDVYGDDVSPLVIWRWDPAVGAYVVPGPGSVDPALGDWVLMPVAGAVVDVLGAEVTANVDVPLPVAGWRQVSAPWAYPRAAIQFVRGADVRTWDQAVTAGWIADVLWGYNPATGAYFLSAAIDPWQGYWLLTKVANVVMRLVYANRTLGVAPELAPLAVPAGAPVPPPPPTAPMAVVGELKVGNFPNPITDVHTTTFRVLGLMALYVEEIRVRVFDLSGKLVWQADAVGSELPWHTDDAAGRYLANGIYLYQVQVKLLGQVLTTGLQKLAIYR